MSSNTEKPQAGAESPEVVGATGLGTAASDSNGRSDHLSDGARCEIAVRVYDKPALGTSTGRVILSGEVHDLDVLVAAGILASGVALRESATPSMRALARAFADDVVRIGAVGEVREQRAVSR